MGERTMRPRKGDIFVLVRDAEGEVKMLIERDKVTDRHRKAARELGLLAIGMLLAKPDQPAPSPQSAVPVPIDEWIAPGGDTNG